MGGSIISPKKRNYQKIVFIVHWLLNWKYSTNQILSDALKLNYKGQARFFSSLVNTGFFLRVNHPFTKEKLLILSKDGKEFSRSLSTNKTDSYSTVSSKIKSATVIHNLNVQREVIKRSSLSLPFDFTPEYFIVSASGFKIPDAICHIDGSSPFAIEIEINHKNDSRIYTAFYDHIQAVKRGDYKTIEYIFYDPVLLNYYQGKLFQDYWPIYYRNKYNVLKPVLELNAPKLMKVDASVKSLFTLTLGELMWMN